MGKSHFRFKRFAVEQDGCAMKVGTDGVLLGAWCRIRPTDKHFLDIGTGTGVIALQLSQRTEHTNSIVDAVEIHGQSCTRARENFEYSDWSERLRLYHAAIQDFVRETPPAAYDHIVSNPPYFSDSLASPDAARTQARHTASLSYENLIGACDALLKPDGLISLILPAAEAGEMTGIAVGKGFFVSRRTEVWSTPKSGPKRLLLEFSRHEAIPELSSLVIEDAGPGSFSEDYRALTRDFYLYF